ncbi:MAG: hypothetical protein KDK08_18700, partial [Rhizobiaceae bacterium]|nr:hypothetical protein [Rhizobiaceae bacterium]
MHLNHAQTALARLCRPPNGSHLPTAEQIEHAIYNGYIDPTTRNDEQHTQGPLRKIKIRRHAKADRIVFATEDDEQTHHARLIAALIVAPVLGHRTHEDTHGFRTGRGVHTAIAAIVEHASTRGPDTVIAQCDVSDAFNSMNARTAIAMMPPRTRKYLTAIQERYREHVGPSAGFPQGHPAGPAIANYVIDLALASARNSRTPARIFGYADDLSCTAAHTNIETTLGEIADGLASHGMHLNPEKTRVTKIRHGATTTILGY